MTAQTLTKEVKLCQRNDFSELCLCLAQIHSADYDGSRDFDDNGHGW